MANEPQPSAQDNSQQDSPLHAPDSTQTTSDQRGPGNDDEINNGSDQLKANPDEGVQMGTDALHLHSAAKGDEDYLNGDDHKQLRPKPERDQH